ncbi:uncharacterized protein LOC123298799 [Chrysoperla carnea]|uniref:uncharacterized protein LOC123298799 n=1 Tax=Chrysoperla carnea TaxID=189513 RepID=UPI001D068414|nr:uncharacterized protein LOC123298799 [Chrysoperla carnea]
MLNAEILRKRKNNKKKHLFTETNFNILPDFHNLAQTTKTKSKKKNQAKTLKSNDSNLAIQSIGDNGVSSNNTVLYDVYRNESTLIENESSESIVYPVQKIRAPKYKNRKSKKKCDQNKIEKQSTSSDELLPTTRKEQFRNKYAENVITNLRNTSALSSMEYSKITPKSAQKSTSGSSRGSKESNLGITNSPAKSIVIKLPYLTYDSDIHIQDSKKYVNKMKIYSKQNEAVNINQHLKAVLNEEKRFALRPKEYGLLGQIWKNTVHC